MNARRRHSRRGGFTLLELTISSAILAVVGYSVSVALELGHESSITVQETAQLARAERRTISTLVDDVRSSTNARISVVADVDGNTDMRLQQPIEVAGALTWGVRDRRLGSDEADWNQADWNVRYLVDGDDRLVRRVVDAAGATRFEDVLADDLRTDAAAFRVVQVGEIWEVSITTRRGEDGSAFSTSEFHVRARN